MRPLLCTTLLTTLLALAIAPAASAVPLDDKDKLQGGLAYVPQSSFLFLHFDVAQLSKTPHVQLLRKSPAKGIPPLLPDFFQSEYGIPFDEVEKITSAFSTDGEVTVITTKKPLDQKVVIPNALGIKRGKPLTRRHAGQTIYVEERYDRDFQPKVGTGIGTDPAVGPPPPPKPQPKKISRYARAAWMVNARTLVMGSYHSVTASMDQQGKEARPGPLTPALMRVSGARHHVSVGGHVPMEFRKAIEKALRDQARRDPLKAALLHNLKPMLSFTSATLMGSVGEETTLALQVDMPSQEQAKDAQESVQFGLEVLHGFLALARSTLENETGIDFDPTSKNKTALLWGRLSEALSKATVRQQGKSLVVQMKAGTEIELVKSGIVETLPFVLRTQYQRQSIVNLKQIGLAMHAMHDTRNSLPLPAWQRSPNRPPVKGAGLSWRVAILPYIEQENLYRQFKLDEPWDSEHNRKLIKFMPQTFAAPGKGASKGLTYYRVFTGQMAAFDLRAPRRLTDILDGTSNTFMVVEAGDPVIWTKPDELTYDPKKPVPKLGGIFPDRFHAVFGDGSVRALKTKEIRESALRAYITARGGEVIPYGSEYGEDVDRQTPSSQPKDSTPNTIPDRKPEGDPGDAPSPPPSSDPPRRSDG